MKATFITHFLLFTAAGASERNYTGGTGLFRLGETPVVDNSTEHEFNLGTTPIAPIGEQQSSEAWSTPLVEDCPKLCSSVGPDPTNWTRIHHQSDLFRCKSPMLFDFNVQSSFVQAFRACAVTAPAKTSGKRSAGHMNGSLVANRQDKHSSTLDLSADGEGVYIKPSSASGYGATELNLDLFFAAGPGVASGSTSDAVRAVDALGSHLDKSSSCGRTILFSKFGEAVVGLYVSADVQRNSAAALVSGLFMSNVQNGSQVMQSCDANGQNPYRMGLFVIKSLNDMELAQKAVKTWSAGDCLTDKAGSYKSIVEVGVLGDSPALLSTNTTEGLNKSVKRTSRLEARADCRAIQVNDNDGCAALAARCGIRGSDFIKYNPKSNLCLTLLPKQWVCCSEGSLPDMTPQPQSDGTCYVHKIGSGDGCWSIAENYGIKQKDIEEYNKKTWGWAGCDRLQPDQIICLSKGNTPMPAQLAGAVCGPQKEGTQKPSGSFDGFDLAKLNQCPLKACCSGWGYCGTTEEFCTESPADTGAPGAFKKGTNGCISNCGTDIVNNKNPPAEFKRVGYFQGYNQARSCLRMDATSISEIPDADLTHIHFAFAGLTPDFDVNIAEGIKPQFDLFLKAQSNKKKIISFGGWAESTDPATFQRYRDAVKPANRNAFADNVMRFLDANPDLEGVDFDWEYPGATDQGVSPSDPIDAVYYLRFLTIMREKLGTGGRSLSIALPASFWYLKPFPVEEMAKVLDYFIYMTYDLHGQWDYGNKFANPGCPTGNCLRSHVNITETTNALVMLTKAGVPAEKIVVGITSYGRSFHMADASCTKENCLFTGSATVSDAEPGTCTDTSGYISNAELNEIFLLAEAGTEGYEAKKWHDQSTNSDMMTYGTKGNGMTDWVAYMSDLTKETRTDWIKGLNFGGTSDWAVDLGQWFLDPSKSPGDGAWKSDHLECISGMFPTTLDELDEDLQYIPAQCRGQALMRVLLRDLQVAVDDYAKVSTDKDYDDRFWWYADWIKDSIDTRIEEFMKLITGEGLKYMDCKWSSPSNSGEGPCTEARPTWKPGPNAGMRIVEFKMRDEDGFYKALADFGIDRKWIEWTKEHWLEDPCRPCNPNLPGSCPGQCNGNGYMRRNWPRRIRDKDQVHIDNPKSVVDAAIPSTEELLATMAGTYIAMRADLLDADDGDTATSFSMPILMLNDATESIKKVLEIGKEHKEAHTRDLVLMIVNIVFAVIPFAGAAASALGGAARIGQIAAIAGELGAGAAGIAEIVDDPTSAPLVILGMITGALGLKGGKPPRKVFKDAADIRRALGDSLPDAFSAEVRRRDAIVQKAVKACAVP